MNVTKVKQQYGWHMVKSLSALQWMLGSEVPNRDVSNDYDRNVSTSQANGDGKGVLLTRNGEDEEIVYSHMKI